MDSNTSSSSITTSSIVLRSESSSTSVHGVLRGSRNRENSCMISVMVGRVICAILACIFALVGSVAGAVTGAVIGLATESGLIRGAGIGAISGAVFSIEVVESSLDLWHSRDSRIWSILYVLDVIWSLFSGRLVREKIGPAMQSAVQSQMSAVTVPVRESPDFFETGGLSGLSKDSIQKLPKIKITAENNTDDSGEKIGCSVCLQDFGTGETARSLPHCHHLFHLPCIDSWLVRHGSCPLCRRNI